MKQVLIPMLLAASLSIVSTASQAVAETPDQCFAQSKQLPADQQEAFVKACLGRTPAQPSTVTPDQRAKVCDSIAEREHFEGEMKASFLKGCKAG